MSRIAAVVIPMRNEQADIEGCLRAVAAQDVGPESLEVIVADGGSTDGSCALVEALGPSLEFGRFECVDNPIGGIGAGLNRAVAAATAELVVRVDARSRIEPHYVRTVLEILQDRADVGVCGGAQVALDREAGLVSAGIARALGNRFTTGLSRYRRGAGSGPADTVWMGAFRLDQLRDMGGWNEDLSVNEDYELCERYRAGGLGVWFEASLRSGYLPRADLVALARQYYTFGRTKGARWAGGAPITGRHVVLLAVPPLAAAGAAVAVRRIGAFSVAGGFVGLLFGIDHFGSSSPAPVPVRSAAVVATVVSDLAWWSGVVTGFLGGRTSR